MPYIKQKEWDAILEHFSTTALIGSMPDVVATHFLATHLCPTCKQPAITTYYYSNDWYPAIHSAWQVYLNGEHEHYECAQEHTWCEKTPAPFNTMLNDKFVYYDYEDNTLKHWDGVDYTAFKEFLNNNVRPTKSLYVTPRINLNPIWTQL